MATKTKTNDQALAAVREALQENRDATIDEVLALVKPLDPTLEKLTRRQFNARYVLPVKRRMAKPAPRPKTREIEGMLQQIAPERMIPYPGLNPRKRFDEEKHAELVTSIREHGNFQPVIVTAAPQSGPMAEKGIDWWVAAGERRWRAAKDAHANLLCLVRSLTYDQAVEMAGLENLHRDDLTAVEEARWIRKMLELADMTQAKLAEKMGCKQPHISNRLRLLDLPDQVLDLIDAGVVQSSHARDHLLPFVKIQPKKVRAQLFADFAKHAHEAAQEDGAPLRGRDVHMIVAEAAVQLSRPIQRDIYGYGSENPVFDPEEHEACDCGSPEFRYSEWRDAPAQIRCFDEAWWNKAQKAAKKRQDSARDRAAARVKAQADKLDRKEVVAFEDVEKIYGFSDRETIATRGPTGPAKFYGGVLIDVSRLPAESLIVVKRKRGNDHELVCTKPGSVRAAKGQLTRELKALTAEKRAEGAAEDMKAVAKKKVDANVLRLLVASAGQSNYGPTPPIARVAIDLGFVDDPEYRWPRDIGDDLTDDQVEMLAKVFHLRHSRGDFDGGMDASEEAARAELRTKYSVALQELLPAPEKKEAA